MSNMNKQGIIVIICFLIICILIICALPILIYCAFMFNWYMWIKILLIILWLAELIWMACMVVRKYL